MPRNSLKMNVLLAGASFLMVFAAVEIFLRLTVYNFQNYVLSPGPNALYVIETDEFKTCIQTNSLNMRDYEIKPKGAQERRILCMGDSFTFGLGVNIPEAYPKILENLLNRNAANLNGWSVINGGTGGNAHQAYEFLMKTGFSFQPDTVIVQIYIGNDFYDNMGRLAGPVSGRVAVSPDNPFKVFIRSQKCRTLEFLWSRLIQIRWIDDILYSCHLRYGSRGHFLRKYPGLEEQLKNMELEDLKRIKDACDARGVSMMALLVPEKQQVFMKRFLSDEKYDYRKPNRILRSFFGTNGVPVMDMLDVYESLPERELKKQYYSRDLHWTADGHVLAARTLKERLS